MFISWRQEVTESVSVSSTTIKTLDKCLVYNSVKNTSLIVGIACGVKDVWTIESKVPNL